MTEHECATILERLDRNHRKVLALARSFSTVRKAAYKSAEVSAAILTKLDQLETRIDDFAVQLKELQMKVEKASP
jgi:uncharacterized protein YeeX (DUF496 family)